MSILTTIKADTEAKARAAAREPFNGYLLEQPRFALTIDDIHSALASAQANNTTVGTGPDSNLDFNVQFLPSEHVAIVAGFHLQPKGVGVDAGLERSIVDAKSAYYRGLISQHKLGSSLTLARFDDSLNITRREGPSDSNSSGGWSQVAAKAAAPRRAPVASAVGSKSGFAVLQSGGTFVAKKSKTQEKKQKKKERKASVADDWEDEMEKEEAELERAIRGESIVAAPLEGEATDAGQKASDGAASPVEAVTESDVADGDGIAGETADVVQGVPDASSIVD